MIEAHGALDVFVRRWAQGALRALGTPDVVTDYILKGRSTRALISMVKALYPNAGFDGPPDRLFALRNDVVHKGKIPEHHEATVVIYHVGKWIDGTMEKTKPLFTITPDVIS